MGKRLLQFVIACVLVVQASYSYAISFTTMYVFGDSLSDVGNLYSYTDNPNPITGGVPIPLSPPYAAGRFQNGPSYSELLWSGLQSSGMLQASGNLAARGLSPTFPPVLNPNAPAGTNYAVGGARSRYHTFDVGGGLPPLGLAPGAATFFSFSLLGQSAQFSADFGGSADPNALFVVWSGSNDLGDALQLGLVGGPAAAQLRLQESLADIGLALGGLVAAGAEHLLVPNLPDLGLVPATNTNPLASGTATSLSLAYNKALDNILDGLLLANPELNVYRFDTFNLLREAVASPTSFGFTDVTDPCLQGLFVAPTGPFGVCANPEEFLFWDVLHPTARTHEVLAAGMQAAIPEPATVLLISLGLITLGIGRRNRA